MKPQSNRQQLGKFGEDFATSYLRREGYAIIHRNFKARYGEIDIIALYGEITVFVEVKTRSDRSFGSPEEAVTPRKLHEVVETADFFMSIHKELPRSMRIDVIAIETDGTKVLSFNHIQNVTM